MKDVAILQSLDGVDGLHAGTEPSHRLDRNTHSGAVDVDGVGELSPTRDGFRIVKLDDSEVTGQRVIGRQRTYDVNTKTGVIAVLGDSLAPLTRGKEL